MELSRSNLNLLESDFSNLFSLLDRLTNEVFFLYDCRKGRFIYVSHPAGAILGYTADKFCDEDMDFFPSIIHPNDYHTVFKWYANSISAIRQVDFKADTPYTNTIVFRVKHGGGKWILIDLSFTLLEGMDDDPGKILGTINDISKRNNYFRNSLTEQLGDPQPVTEISLGSKGHDEVTRREKEVLHLIADGFSAKEVADKLFISIHTAINHRKNLIVKFRVKNTAELIKVASKYFWL